LLPRPCRIRLSCWLGPRPALNTPEPAARAVSFHSLYSTGSPSVAGARGSTSKIVIRLGCERQFGRRPDGGPYVRGVGPRTRAASAPKAVSTARTAVASFKVINVPPVFAPLRAARQVCRGRTL